MSTTQGFAEIRCPQSGDGTGLVLSTERGRSIRLTKARVHSTGYSLQFSCVRTYKRTQFETDVRTYRFGISPYQKGESFGNTRCMLFLLTALVDVVRVLHDETAAVVFGIVDDVLSDRPLCRDTRCFCMGSPPDGCC